MSDWSILITPALAGVLVLLSHVPLGVQVLRRGIVFIDLAIAQMAALGVLIVGSFTAAVDTGGVTELASAVAALAGAGLVAWLNRLWPAHREALIGLVYVAGAVLALLWVSTDHRGAQKLASMLSGDVLWVTWAQLLPLTLASAAFLAVHALKPDAWSDSRVFYPWFAILVSLSVPLLGLYLVFATLIVPALVMLAGARTLPPDDDKRDRAMASTGNTIAAIALGATGYVTGLLLSLWQDLPSGPCVVLALMSIGTLVAIARAAAARTRAGFPR